MVYVLKTRRPNVFADNKLSGHRKQVFFTFLTLYVFSGRFVRGCMKNTCVYDLLCSLVYG